MRKLFLCLLMALFAMTATLKAQVIVFTDGFENGLNPTSGAPERIEGDLQWSQEYYVPATTSWTTVAPAWSQSWKTETGGARPENAVSGKGRAYFRNEHGQTEGYKTRLVTPWMNLDGVYQPILRFYHAQNKWTADFDTLRVFYRSGKGTAWSVLAEYKEPIKKWTFEELDLPNTGADYQLAFEASENLGYGIVLDSVLVRSKPQITTPYNVQLLDQRDNGVTIQWQASMDADEYQFVFASENLDLNVNPDAINNKEVIIKDTLIDSDVFSLRMENMASGKTYYVQIRSIGETENSVWCDPVMVYNKPTVKLPYTEEFEIPQLEGTKLWNDTWTWGGALPPISLCWVGQTSWPNYSYNNTGAVGYTGLLSSGSPTNETVLPGGVTAYMASPEISLADGEKISDCHVTFWGSVYTFTTNSNATNAPEYARSLIVGIMTDPQDLTTFEALDTCFVWGYKEFVNFDVSFASYKGDGRYVAFLSDFEIQNLFYIDGVTIEKRPAIAAVQRSSISVVPGTTSATLTWAPAEGATSYNVKYVKTTRKGELLPLFASELKDATVVPASTNSITLEGLTPGAQYDFAIQGAGGAWSQPDAFFTSVEIDAFPITFSFEENEDHGTFEGTYYRLNNTHKIPFGWLSYTSEADCPYIYTTSGAARTGTGALGLQANRYTDAWVVSPMIDRLDTLEVSFYIKQYSSSNTSNVEVGIMTDPSDLSTFEKVSTFYATANYSKCYVNFANYKGKGKYLALNWGHTSDGTKSSFYIDDLTIKSIDPCPIVAPLDITALNDTLVTIQWPAAEEPGVRYDIKIHKSELAETLVPVTNGDFANIKGYTGNSLTIDTLDWKTTYYFYIQKICSATDSSEWVGTSFTTECPEKVKLPYATTFTKEGKTGTGAIPFCWTPSYNSTTTTYPYIYSTASYAHSGLPLYMYATTTYGSFIAMPELDAPLDEIVLEFYVAGTSGYLMYVGVMTDPTDPDTFVKIDSVAATGTSTHVYRRTTFGNYTGVGRYIAFSSFNGKTNTVYLSDVSVRNLIDLAPTNFNLVDASDESLTVSWEGKTSDAWKVVVTNKEYAVATFDPTKAEADNAIVAQNDNVQNKSFAIPNGLTPQTHYYFYVRSTKGTQWGMGDMMTECTKINPRAKYSESFESYGKTCVATLTASQATYDASGEIKTYPGYFKNALVPECWTVGNSGYGVFDWSYATTYTIRNYFPYVCSNGTGTTSLNNYYDKGTALTSYNYNGVQSASDNNFNSLKLYGYYTSGIAWAAMPTMDIADEELNNLVLTFTYQKANVNNTATAANYGNALIVGLMEDPTDLSTFHVLDSIYYGKGVGGKTYSISHEIVFADALVAHPEAKGKNIAFRTSINSGTGASYMGKAATTTVYLDNINLSLASCMAPSPSITQVTDSSARVNSGLRSDNAWQYILSLKPMKADDLDKGTMPAPEDIIKQETIGDGETQVTYAPLKNLLADTTYYVALQTLCPPDGGSAWKVINFNTLCNYVDIESFEDGFEDYQTGSGKSVGCWTVGNINSAAAVSYIPYVESSKLTGSKQVLKIYSYKTSANGAYAVTPGLKFPEGKSIKDYQVRFKAMPSSSLTALTQSTSYEYRICVGIVDNPSNISSLVTIDTIVYSSPDVVTSVVDFGSYTGNGEFVVFYNFVSEKTYTYMYIDDVKFDLAPTCKHVTGIKVDSVGAKGVKLSWKETASKYNVALSKKLYHDSVKTAMLASDSVRLADGIVMATVLDSKAEITGLEPNTSYYVYVQAVCGESEQSVWSYETPMFLTDCAPMKAPIKETFESYATGDYCKQKLGCWEMINYNGTTYPKIGAPTTGATSGKQLELWSSGTSYRTVALMPEIEGNLSDYVLSFDARSYGVSTASVLYIGTMSDINDSTTFVPFDTLYMDGGNEFYHQELVLADYNLVHSRIAFTSGLATTLEKTSDMYMDNVRLGKPVSCFTPTNLIANNPTDHSVVLQFAPAGTDTKWEAMVTNIKTNAEKVISLTSDSVVIDGLEHSTSYSLKVRSDCDGDFSDWSDPVTISTLWQIDGYYTWTFDINEQGTMSARTPLAAATSTYIIHPALTSASGSKGTAAYYPYQIPNTVTYAKATNAEIPVVGVDTAYALQFQTTATYDSAALILPVISNPNAKRISWNMRAGYAYASDYSTATSRNVVSTVYRNAKLLIGTVEQHKGISTFTQLAEFVPSLMVAKDTLKANSNYGWDHIVFSLKDVNMTGKQVAFMMRGCGSATLFMDDLAIEADEEFSTPMITSLAPAVNTVTVNYSGNPERAYNILVVDTTKAGKYSAFMPYIQDIVPGAIDTIKGVHALSYEISGLESKHTYMIYVEDSLAASQSRPGALSNRKITHTVCEAIDGNGYYTDFTPGDAYFASIKAISDAASRTPSNLTQDGFEFYNPSSTTASDTVYKYPACWHVSLSDYDLSGTSTYRAYAPNMFGGSDLTYNYGKGDRYALSMGGRGSTTTGASYDYCYGSSTYANMPMAIMPLMNLDMDTAEVQFWGRCAKVTASTNKIYSNSYLKGSTTYSQKIEVGTVMDPEDPSTFVVLDTVECNKYTNANVTSSSVAGPDNDYYFQKFNVRLAGATGKYIAFRQIGYGIFLLDDLSIIKAQTCRVPDQVIGETLSDTSIIVKWRGRENEDNYILEISKSSIDWTKAVTYNVSDSAHYCVTGLDAATEYFVRVAQVSTKFGKSVYSEIASVRTDCLPINPNGYKTGFECDANQGDPWYVIPGVTNATYKQNQCWLYLNHGTTALTSSGSTSWPYNICDGGPKTGTSGNSYSLEGSYALKLYATGTTFKGVAVTPAIDAEIGVPGKGFDTLQVHFWACPTYVILSSKKFSSQGNTYAKTVEVGTCTDPNDPETYTVLQVCTYEVPGNSIGNVVTSAAENWGYKEFTVKLNKATGPYVFLRASRTMADGAEKTYSTMYIDNLEFQKIQLCEAPASASVTDVNAFGATISWEADDAAGYDLDVSTDPTFSDSAKFVYIAKDLTAKSVTLSDTLQPGTVYYYRVRRLCDSEREEVSVWLSTGLNFRTAFVPIFNENFNTEDLKSTAKGWITMSRKFTANEVFNGAALQDTATTAVYDSWYRVQNYALSGYALRSYLYYTSSSYDYYFQKNWLVSPSIYVESDKANLTFNAALTYYSVTNTSANKDIRQDAAWNTGWDDQFMVIVSEDDGATWKKENATIWNNEASDDPTSEHYLYGKGQYVLTDIPANGEQIMVDLGAYKGKQIKIAFYAENTVQNAKNAIHIDNIHVNYLTHLKQEMEMCQFEDIDDVLGFSVDGDKAEVGYMPMKKVVLSTKNGVNDSIYELNATYLEAPQYEYSITVCKDYPFSWGGFNEHSAPGTYRMKLKSKVTGCDSIVDFHLSHIEKFERDIDTTLCYGASITIGNHTYTEAGEYSDTLVSALGGCDSIINLSLNYRPRNLVMVYDTINVGETYPWEGESFNVTTMGYEKTFVDQFGCDSIRQLNLLVFDPTVIYTNETTCQGTPVTWRGKQYSEAAEYRDTVMEAGVEKVYALVLVVNPVDEVSIRETICDGNFFEFNNEKLTKTGTYTATFSNQYGCDSIVTLNLTVQMPTAQTINAEICQGTFYEFAGQQLTKSGIYYDTTYTSLGCVDVTTTLNLVVAEPLKGAMTKEICEGDAFTFNGKTYSESGVYTDTLSTEAGCDSILTITIIQTMDVHDTIIAYVCPGETYKDQYFDTNEPGKHELEITTPAGCRVNEVLYLYNYQIPVSKTQKIICQGSYVEFGGRQYSTTGVYTDTLKGQSAQGCDSVAVLELFVLDADTMRVNVTIQDTELPYAYEGTPIDYEVGTLPGTYVDTVSVQIEGCEAVIIHTLVIQETQAIDNVNSTPSMVLRPTLLDKGQVVYIDYDFTAADKQDLNVEVTDMLGKLVSSKKVDGEDLQVSDFPVSGIYTIRVTSGTGLNMTGRVVVR